MIRKGLLISTFLIVIMLGLSLWALPHLPADGRFASHWNINGVADGYSGRAMVLWFMPALGAGVALVLSLVPLIDPRRKNLLRSSLAYLVAWGGGLVVIAFAHAMMVLNAAERVDLADISHGPGLLRALALLIGAMTMALGAVLGKVRPNWFLGVRTPWTLSSDLSWDKTHRLAGWLFMLTGLATLATALVLIPRWAMLVLLGGTMGTALIAVVYSFLVWKGDPARETLVPESAD